MPPGKKVEVVIKGEIHTDGYLRVSEFKTGVPWCRLVGSIGLRVEGVGDPVPNK